MSAAKTAKHTCFVISPIGEENSPARKRSDLVLDYIIKPAAKENGYEAIRSDRIASSGMITVEIIRQLMNAPMVVADLTDHNANVFYELAIRHAFQKPVVLLIQEGQHIPFDIKDMNVIHYGLSMDAGEKARNQLKQHIEAASKEGYRPESTVSFAAKFDAVYSGTSEEIRIVLKTLSDQINGMTKTIENLSRTACSAEDFRRSIPPIICEHIDEVLEKYAQQIELLRSIRAAGIVGVFRRRESALKRFARAIDAETQEVFVVGSSLKGLLQNNEYRDISEKLRFKHVAGNVRVKFLITHPIVADFRASQEKRSPGEIGLEIIDSLRILKSWKVPCENVRLYLGTPTCFAIKTAQEMLVNPYPYGSVSYDFPCLLLESSPDSSYFYDAFNACHFAAWDTKLAVPFGDYDTVMHNCETQMMVFKERVADILNEGKDLLKSSDVGSAHNPV